MSKYQLSGNPKDDTQNQQSLRDASRREDLKRYEESNDRLAIVSGNILDRADTIIYAIVGACFLIGAIIALIYTFWEFGVAVFFQLPTKSVIEQPAIIATAIINFVSGLLLVLIIMEVLGTVTNYLKSHATSLRPFLFIGIISATRSVLSIGAKLSVGQENNMGAFYNAMIELGVSAAVILALGLTLKLLGQLVEDKAMSPQAEE